MVGAGQAILRATVDEVRRVVGHHAPLMWDEWRQARALVDPQEVDEIANCRRSGNEDDRRPPPARLIQRDHECPLPSLPECGLDTSAFVGVPARRCRSGRSTHGCTDAPDRASY